MNLHDELNRKYWSTVSPDMMLAGLSIPGSEFLNAVLPPATVLDVGCGTGIVSEFLNAKGYAVTGIDINEEALRQNAERHPEILYVSADIGTPLPFNDESFDAIVISYVLVSIIDSSQRSLIASELARVLKIGGLLWICEATHSEDYAKRSKLGALLTGEGHTALSLSKTDEARALADKGDVEELRKRNLIDRVIRHYTEEDLVQIFTGLSKEYSSPLEVRSPNSGMLVESLVMMFRKTAR